MKNLFLKSLLIFLTFLPLSVTLVSNAVDLEGFNLTEEEKQQFDQEIMKDMIDFFNNLSPEEMQKFEEMSKELEQQMRDEGYDPENLDDALKWAEKKAEEAIEKASKGEEASTENSGEASTKESIKAIDFAANSSEFNATAMLLNTSAYLSELRQKSISYDEINKKLARFSSELNEFSYFLHSLTNADIMKHLLSKDFENLYKNIESLYQTLAKHVPLILPKEIEESSIENPYQTLGLANLSTSQEVDNAYHNLKEMFDVDKIREQLEKQNTPEQEIAKTVKQSKISFSFIQDAYDALKDSKQKAILDKKIQEEAEIQKRMEASSYQAFDEIYKVLTDKLFPILSDIKKLFEKHKPEEISKAKEYDDREKKLLAESKKPFKVIKGDSGKLKFRDKDGEYDEFYRHVAQKDRSQKTSSYKPLFDDSFDPDFFSDDRGKQDKALDKSKEGEKKPGKDDKKDDKKKDEKKDDKKDDKKGGSPKKEANKESEILGEIGVLAKLLDNAEKLEKQIEVEPRVPTRRPAGDGEQPQPEKVKIKIEDIREGLNKYLITDPATIQTEELQIIDTEPLRNFLTFAQKNDIENIAGGLKKVTPKGKPESEAVSKMLKDKILKHKPLIETWYKEFYPVLSPNKRAEAGLTPMNINKQNVHRLGTASTRKEHIDEATLRADQASAAFGYIPKENLYKVREFIKGIYDSVESIEKSIGKPEPKK